RPVQYSPHCSSSLLFTMSSCSPSSGTPAASQSAAPKISNPLRSRIRSGRASNRPARQLSGHLSYPTANLHQGNKTMTLALAFALIAALGIALYVLADGFDLGIGILFLLAPREQDRDVMMESIAPVWDGNETWLVFGGSLLLAA